VTPLRGEIWWVRQPIDSRQAADVAERRRPYLVVSSDVWNLVATYPRISLCPLTGMENVPRRYDTDVVLRKKDTRLPKDSIARCVEIYTVFRSVLVERVSRLSEAKLREVEHALQTYLALGPL
jgi:mRNA-degrading endonuclease toxin of MazEF toxin-antitoxin module